MTDHLTPHDTPRHHPHDTPAHDTPAHDTPPHETPPHGTSRDGASDDAFDRFARAAGAELRRPAPPDGMQRVRTARRRRQATRSVVTGGAAVLVLGLGSFVALRGTDDGGDVATLPDPTVPDPTVPDPTVPPDSAPQPTPTTVPDPTVPDPTVTNAEVEAWLAEQRAEGRTLVQRATGDGTDAYGLLAQSPDGADVRGVVVLPDGSISDVPTDVVPGIWPTMRVYGLGDSIAVVAQLFGGTATEPVPVELHLLDPVSGEWTAGPDLGLDRELGQGLHVLSVDGSLVVGRSVWDETGGNAASPSPDRAGVIVRPDLTLEPVATPPDGVQMEWTSSFDRWALNFGLEPGALDYTPYTQPWKLDVETNEWTAIALPDWFDCEPAVDCQWFTPHEFGDRFLEVVTDRGVVKRVPDGTVGVYVPATDTWTRVDDAPFALAMPATAVVDDRVVVAPARAPYTEEEQDDFGRIGVLDLATGTWSVERFEVADDDSRWELRADAAGVLVQAVPIDPAGALELDRSFAFDRGAPDWRPTTSSDADRWTAAATKIDLAG